MSTGLFTLDGPLLGTGRGNVEAAEQLLNRADVAPVLQVGREGVARVCGVARLAMPPRPRRENGGTSRATGDRGIERGLDM